MEKNKHKFIYFVIFLIIIIIFIWIFINLFSKSVDRNTYIELVKWSWNINWKNLILNNREKISKNDTIETSTKDSLAIIEWWDWSITRLWWNTKINVKELFTSEDKNVIKIAFDTFSWKTWSNVISYISDESYFNQYYKDTEIAVRWTVYALDIEKNYLHVENHEVLLKNKEIWEIKLEENKKINILNFKFISLDEFIKYFKDNDFFDINIKLDREYFLKLVLDIQKNLENFKKYSSKQLKNLTLDQKDKLFKSYLSAYQDLNFIELKNSEKLFDLKLKIKNKLLDLAPENQKENILRSLNYDFKELFDLKKFEYFDKFIEIFKENEKYLKKDSMYNFLSNFNQNFKPGETFSQSMDNFKNLTKNDPMYKFLFNSLGSTFDETIKNQQWVFDKIYFWFKNLFN